jgi:hypothetical protein
METTTRRRSIGGIVQALGRHRKALAVVLLALFLATPCVWWATQLWGLPDIGDPFDVAAFEAEHVPDDRNAFRWYRDAATMAEVLWTRFQNSNTSDEFINEPDNWQQATPAWRDLLAQSGEALKLWRIGSEKPDARYDHPDGLSMWTLLPITTQLRILSHLAVLEGSRLEAEGDMVGAWGWYRATLRSSRHSGKHGFQVERLVGAAMHDHASQALSRWASDPRVDAVMLRLALDEVIAIDTMTVPRSETLKVHYLVFVHSLPDPNFLEDLLMFREQGDPADWCQDLPISKEVKKPIQAARVIGADDRERSLRLARLLTANWLAEVDKPPARRSKLARNDPPIYDPDPAGPPSSRVLTPEKLSKWLDSSLLASRHFRALSKYDSAIDRERGRQARLVLHLAGELYRREHGEPPPSPRNLVGPYLKALPEGLKPTPEPTR